MITKDAKTSVGVFKVHVVRDRGTDHYYYEIPTSELGKDFLFVNQIAKNTLGAGYGGQTVGEMVGRWERRENRILLREMNYDLIANPAEPIAKAVQAADNPSIVMAFNIEAFGPDESAVIDVSRLFLSDVPEMSVRARLRARGMDTSRSFIEHVSAFPQNIEAEATQTYTSAPADQQGGGRGGPGGAGRGGMRSSSGTVAGALQHGEASRKADDAEARRCARRLLHHVHHGFQPSRASRREARVRGPLAPGEERSHGRGIRAGEAAWSITWIRRRPRNGCRI